MGRNDKKSSTVLTKVRDALAARFSSTAIRNDRNAVVLHFAGGNRPVDVVPAFHVGPFRDEGSQFRNYPLFVIPDGTGGWLQTSPQIHGAALRAEDERSGGKLRRLALLAKYWAICHANCRLHSFHAEIMIACSGICVGPKSYSVAVHEFFSELSSRAGRGIRDPLKISGVIPALESGTAGDRLVNAARSAAGHSANALRAEAERDTAEAIRQWKIVFGGSFPS